MESTTVEYPYVYCHCANNYRMNISKNVKGLHGSFPYKEIFSDVFKIIDILLTLPAGTASVKHSFSQMKVVRMRFRNRISNMVL